MTEVRSINSTYTTEGNTLVGLIPYDAPTTINEGGKRFTETIKAGAFRSSFTADVISTFNHDVNRLLGRTFSGTLSLIDTPQGLRWTVNLPEHAADIKEMVARGDLQGCSFTFQVNRDGDSWAGQNRELRDLRLIEVGPVVMPAYSQSTVALRSKEHYRRKLKTYEI
jgi:uncharacterized protein